MTTGTEPTLPTDERGDSPCSCPVNSWGSPDCQESNPPDTYCKWERLIAERAAEDREPDGECYRGGEYAASVRDEMAEARKLK